MQECFLSVDLRGKSIEIITPDDIPSKTQDLYLSNNKIAKLPNDIFFTKCRIWNIYLDYNILSDLKFITCFQYLGTLDLRHNCLEIDDILDLTKIHILHLYLEGNNFQKYTCYGPLTIPALLKRAWNIDGFFITDYTRKRAKDFKKTKPFGEIVLSARRHPIPFHQQESISNAAKSFLGGATCRFVDPSRFLNSTGIEIQFLTKKPQIDRLRYLATHSNFHLPEGNFIDLFGITLGILSNHWCGYPVPIIPRVISRAYWSLFSEEFSKMENWMEFVVLYQIDSQISPRNEKESDIWSRINLRRYLQQGSIPHLGSFSRLLIGSLIYRSDELSDEILKSEDMMIYVKYRNSYDFGPADSDLIAISDELLMNIPVEATVIPHKNDSVSIRHPFTNEWVSCNVIELINGRAILKVDNIFIQPIAIDSLFWDGRGFFREKQKIENPIQKVKSKQSYTNSDEDDFLFDKSSQKVNKRRTFLTIADSVQETESAKQDAERFSIPLPPCAIPPKNVLPREDPSYFLQNSQNLMNSDSITKAPPPLTPTKTCNINVNVNEAKLVKMKLKKTPRKAVTHSPFSRPIKTAKSSQSISTPSSPASASSSTFRGIVDPVPRRTKKVLANSTLSKKPTQIVDCVVNVTLGPEVANFRRIRIFHVRVMNTITKKFSYVNIKEDEIPESDAARLVELYKQHIESKMIVIQNE